MSITYRYTKLISELAALAAANPLNYIPIAEEHIDDNLDSLTQSLEGLINGLFATGGGRLVQGVLTTSGLPEVQLVGCWGITNDSKAVVYCEDQTLDLTSAGDTYLDGKYMLVLEATPQTVVRTINYLDNSDVTESLEHTMIDYLGTLAVYFGDATTYPTLASNAVEIAKLTRASGTFTVDSENTDYPPLNGLLLASEFLQIANNLSDLDDVPTARTNLGLGSAALDNTGDFATAAQGALADSALQSADIGSSIQAYDADLAAIAALSTQAYGRALLELASEAAFKALVNLEIGTDVQAQNANLQALAGLTTIADRLSYWTGSGAAALTTLTSYARTLLDDINAVTARATLGFTSPILDKASPGAIGTTTASSVTATQFNLPASSQNYSTGELRNNGNLIMSMLQLYGDAFQFSTIVAVEYWNGSSWVAYSKDVSPLFSGYPSDVFFDTDKPLFRFTINAVDYPDAGIVLIGREYNGMAPQSATLTLERAPTSAFASVTTLLNSVSLGTNFYNINRIDSNNSEAYYRFTFNYGASTLPAPPRHIIIRLLSSKLMRPGIQKLGMPLSWDYAKNLIIEGGLQISGNTVITSARHPQLRSYTVATLPSAATAGQYIYVSDETGGAVTAFSDGTNWRRSTDRAIVS